MKRIRNIRKETNFARVIWDIEKKLPRVLRQASLAWTKNFAEFTDFWRSCGEIWGYFEVDADDNEQLQAAVYLEFLRPDLINIHLSVLQGVGSEELADFFTRLKLFKRSEGVIEMQAWVLSRNNSLKKIMRASGFTPSGLKMDYGELRGKDKKRYGRVLNWTEFRG